ncbi:Uu.00g025460.m01.CDS01 [Anthostomella pinea]|uniref:Uu.00g025460.m01.CDS01 n=1 Tax=Anthostomella pinea TaxID=933095 RepID=A0AAI8V7E3_9PEZI|nr:Uu.00g025460.m01.CDS01 [Anthostomella pinea]
MLPVIMYAHPVALATASLLSLHLLTASALYQNGTMDVVNVRWLEGTQTHSLGTTFGLPWPSGRYWLGDTGAASITGSTSSGEEVRIQSWATAYWADGSIKWTGHALPGSETVPDGFTVRISNSSESGVGSNSTSTPTPGQANMAITDNDNAITVDTGKLTVSFPKSGKVIVGTIKTPSGKIVGQNGKLILQSQSGIVEDAEAQQNGTSIERFHFESVIEETSIGGDSSVRALVTVRGKHQISAPKSSGVAHAAWLPFIVRFYLYAESDAIRAVHTLVYDVDASKNFITGIGIRFEVPLAGEELYNRHVRIAGVDGGFMSEAVQGITGLRRDPGEEVRTAQFNGEETPDAATWDSRVTSRLKWIPAWNDYSLAQLSPDGFTLKKRTKAGQSWVKIPGGTRAGGLAYLGGATTGGLAVGLRDFWKRYPTGIDIGNAASDTGQVTLWLYSPAAEPMDLRAFHDGMGEDTYAEQLDALEITYEDYEGAYNTPKGIARTNEIFIYAFDSTPPADVLSALTDHTNTPPFLVAEPELIKKTNAVGTYWDVPDNATASAQTVETHLDFLIKYYQGQVEQRRWYGFWDHGDVMHTYDEDRHTWRYDVGGYAWDNSELSPDLFFWNYFLRTGRSDVYRFAEAHTRHTREVDVYHIGPYKGFGTRHGVQHWGDSSKQIRVSTPIYSQIFYYLSGGDERVGELMHELMDADQAFITVDPRRKVRQDNGTYVADPTAIDLDLGLDWSGLAATWLLEWERRGPRWEEARSKLSTSMQGIANLTNGFVTGLGLYNIYTGAISPPATDPQNLGNVTVSHLSASFGLPEIIAQINEYLGEDMLAGFESVWLDYCYYYGAGATEQEARYGVSFGTLNLRQGHSRLTAYAARVLDNSTLAERAWNEFFNTDGLAPGAAWASESLSGSHVLAPVDEAAWLATNDAALYGLAGIELLAQVAYALGTSGQTD